MSNSLISTIQSPSSKSGKQFHSNQVYHNWFTEIWRRWLHGLDCTSQAILWFQSYHWPWMGSNSGISLGTRSLAMVFVNEEVQLYTSLERFYMRAGLWVMGLYLPREASPLHEYQISIGVWALFRHSTITDKFSLVKRFISGLKVDIRHSVQMIKGFP